MTPASGLLARPLLHSTYITASGSAHPWIASRNCAAAQQRAFGATSGRQVQAGRPSGASTALKENVKHREEEQHVPVVGGEGKGVEGPHYQGESSSCATFELQYPDTLDRGHLAGTHCYRLTV